MKTFVGATILSAASATCTGSSDPVVSAAQCYQGSTLGETINVDIKTFASAKGTLSLTASGLKGFTCGDHDFTKAGQDITVDLSDCLPSGVTIESVKYCSDSDQINVLVKDGLEITATASRVACGGSYALAQTFDEFIKQFDRKYATPEEHAYRQTVFGKNLDWINAENAKGKSYTVGVTQFADRTFHEFRAQYLTGYIPTKKNSSVATFRAPSNFVEEDSVDWTTKGAVTPVKNQAQCGSCWSFSTTGALEGAWFIAGHGLPILSEQNILDCDTGGNKCSGGSMEQAFEWVKDNGICSEEDDPYKCTDQSSSECTSSTCSSSSGTCTKVLQAGDVTGSVEVSSDSESALEAAVTKQPVSVAIEADQTVFQHYTGGIVKSEDCGENLDHGVLAVGYGTDGDQKYWKVKNSWGATWGEDGYVRVLRGSDQTGGECGILQDASYPTVKGANIGIVV